MVDKVDELVDELQREKQKNAELLRRISTLEAQILQHRRENDSSHAPFVDTNNICQDSIFNNTKERISKKHQRQKANNNNNTSTKNHEAILKLDDTQPPKDSKLENNEVVSWMRMDDTQLPRLFDKFKDVESMLGWEDTDDDSDDEHQPCTYEATKNCVKIKDEDEGASLGKKMHYMNSQDNQNNKMEFRGMNRKLEQDWEEEEKSKGFRNFSMQKKSLKVAFCPKEVRGILESRMLDMKNAQSHTMRKSIVFASLGIRHGCDDLYELDYNHFSISRKGESYASYANPGEHVLYENPSGKKKVFYPNRANPSLCPVQILEEERAMRPSDSSCPSCLFLCIKYGGKTRNIPQNEYVRQQMGRNKLKSFGPLICVMARLVNIRTGSFFFKALGITLLFMAGFPVDSAQSETKHRKLDLFQKYYRTDEDAAGEELFLANLSTSELATPDLEKPISKTKRCKRKNQIASSKNNDNSENTLQETVPPGATFQTTMSSSNNVILQPNILYNQHPLCPMLFPPHPVSAITPLIYWPPIHNAAYPTWPHPSTFGYQSFEGMYHGHYMSSVHPCPPLYSQGLGSHIAVNSNEAADATTDSASSSCSTEPK